jgi:hypothetical protein
VWTCMLCLTFSWADRRRFTTLKTGASYPVGNDRQYVQPPRTTASMFFSSIPSNRRGKPSRSWQRGSPHDACERLSQLIAIF